MKRRSIGLFLALAGVMTSAGICFAAELTAEHIFRELPPEIFDNTSRPLTEADKEKLLDTGHYNSWVISENNADVLTFISMHNVRESVRVKVFRKEEDGGVAVLSAQSPDGCASEVWAFNEKGGLVPASDIPEAGKEDYFLPGRALPPGLAVTNSLCFDGDLLVLVPGFWGDDGALSLRPDREVLLVWHDGRFVKVAAPPPMDLSGFARETPGGSSESGQKGKILSQ